MSDDLKPCPFCGANRARFVNPGPGEQVYVVCDFCGARGQRYRTGAESLATNAWNTRANLCPSPEVVEKMREALKEIVLNTREDEGGIYAEQVARAALAALEAVDG